MFTLMPRILMVAHVIPRPAVKSAFLDMGDVVGHKIVPQTVTLVHRAPQNARLGLNGQPASGIANPVGVDAHRGSIGIELQNVRAILLTGSSVGIIDIGSRAYRDKHLFAVRRELHIPRPVPSAEWQVRNVLRRPGRLQVSVLVEKTNHGIGVPHVNPLRVIARRIKGNPIRTVKPGGKNAGLLRFAIRRDAAENLNIPAAALRQEKIPVRSGANQPGIIETCRIELHSESRWRLRPSAFGPRDQLWSIVRRVRGIRRGKIVDRYFADVSWLLEAKIKKRRLRLGGIFRDPRGGGRRSGTVLR